MITSGLASDLKKVMVIVVGYPDGNIIVDHQTQRAVMMIAAVLVGLGFGVGASDPWVV